VSRFDDACIEAGIGLGDRPPLFLRDAIEHRQAQRDLAVMVAECRGVQRHVRRIADRGAEAGEGLRQGFEGVHRRSR